MHREGEIMELNFLDGLILGVLVMLCSAVLAFGTAVAKAIQKREQNTNSLIVDITVNSEPALKELDKIKAKLEEVIALQERIK